MKNRLTEQQKETIRNASSVVVDLSDTIVEGNVSYGAINIAKERAKKGKLLDALKLGLNGIRIYATNHLRNVYDEWNSENQTLIDLYKCLDKYHVTKKEMEDAAKSYLNNRLFKKPGVKEFLETIRNFGKKKELCLLTKESSECAEVAGHHFGFDRVISNVTRFKEDDTINGVEIRMKRPEDKSTVLQKELSNLGKVVMISDNREDSSIFGGKVGLFIPYSRKGNAGLSIDDYAEFSKSLRERQ